MAHKPPQDLGNFDVDEMWDVHIIREYSTVDLQSGSRVQ